jgi:hypothetical protein
MGKGFMLSPWAFGSDDSKRLPLEIREPNSSSEGFGNSKCRINNI